MEHYSADKKNEIMTLQVNGWSGKQSYLLLNVEWIQYWCVCDIGLPSVCCEYDWLINKETGLA